MIELVLDKSAITFEHNDQVNLCAPVQGDKVFIFKSLVITGCFSQFCLSVDCATLSIEDSLDEIRSLDLHRMRHKHQVHRGKSLNLHSEYAVDAGKQGARIFFHVREVGPCNLT